MFVTAFIPTTFPCTMSLRSSHLLGEQMGCWCPQYRWEKSPLLQDRVRLPTSRRGLGWCIPRKLERKVGKTQHADCNISASPSLSLVLEINTNYHQANAFKSFPCWKSETTCRIGAKGSADLSSHWQTDPMGSPCIHTSQRIWPVLENTSKGDYHFMLPQADHTQDRLSS